MIVCLSSILESICSLAFVSDRTGTETCVRHALISTKEDVSHHEYWLTDIKGRKVRTQSRLHIYVPAYCLIHFLHSMLYFRSQLCFCSLPILMQLSDEATFLLQEALQSFVYYCKPREEAPQVRVCVC